MKNFRNKELLITILLLNLAAAGFYASLFVGVKEKNERISNLVNGIEAEASAESLHHATEALVTETSPLREKLRWYVVGREEAVSFLELLERTGSDIGATVAIESVTKGTLEQPLSEELRLALTVLGTWSEVVRYVGLLEFLPLQARVEQLVVSRTEHPDEGPWRGEIALIVLKEK